VGPEGARRQAEGSFAAAGARTALVAPAGVAAAGAERTVTDQEVPSAAGLAAGASRVHMGRKGLARPAAEHQEGVGLAWEAVSGRAKEAPVVSVPYQGLAAGTSSSGQEAVPCRSVNPMVGALGRVLDHPVAEAACAVPGAAVTDVAARSQDAAVAARRAGAGHDRSSGC